MTTPSLRVAAFAGDWRQGVRVVALAAERQVEAEVNER
jgi:hypothetical protein